MNKDYKIFEIEGVFYVKSLKSGYYRTFKTKELMNNYIKSRFGEDKKTKEIYKSINIQLYKNINSLLVDSLNKLVNGNNGYFMALKIGYNIGEGIYFKYYPFKLCDYKTFFKPLNLNSELIFKELIK
jgi:hypothetical protein